MSRSLQVAKTYLRRGQAVSRSTWIRVSPKHPLFKVVAAPPTAAILLTILVLILIILGFTLLAFLLMETIWRARAKDSKVG